MQHSTDFGCSADLASGLPPEVSPRPAGGSRCVPRMPYPHDPAEMPPPVCWCLPAADRLRRNAVGCAGGNPQIVRIAYLEYHYVLSLPWVRVCQDLAVRPTGRVKYLLCCVFSCKGAGTE